MNYDSYGATCQDGLLHVIGKSKADLALDLMGRACQNFRSGGADELKMENMLNEMLNMIEIAENDWAAAALHYGRRWTVVDLLWTRGMRPDAWWHRTCRPRRPWMWRSAI